MNVGSLFSGIGGLDLGLERAGMNVIWQSEIDPYATRVLAKHWPTVPNLGDITTIDWTTVDRPDLIAGGYPCQPFSLAGVRRGDTDPRHLWPHFRDALRHLRPRFALLENVPGHLSLGFGRVLGDLAELGYDCEWDCIPAAAVGAPHLRYRVFVVAHANSESEPGVAVDAIPGPGIMVPDTIGDVVREQSVPVAGSGGPAVTRHDGPNRDVADPYGSRFGQDEPDLQPGQHDVDGCRATPDPNSTPRLEAVDAEPGTRPTTPGRGATQPRGQVGSGWDWWAVEPDVGRVAHGVPHRVDRLRTLGNAVVPQVAEWIGRRILEAAA